MTTKKKIDVLALTALLKEDPEEFVRQVSEVIAQAKSAATKQFWREMKELAEDRLKK